MNQIDIVEDLEFVTKEDVNVATEEDIHNANLNAFQEGPINVKS